MSRGIHNKHDAFFRSLMSDIEVAKAFMRNFLPDELKAVVDLSGLKHVPSSYISEKMKQTYADVVFECPLLETHVGLLVHLCLLAEHKSTPYKFSNIQTGGYVFDAYRQQIKNKQDPLIPVIPIIYYHGEQEWVPPSIPELFDGAGKEVLSYIPSIRTIFHSLTEFSDDQLKQLGNGLLTSAMLAQKYSSRPDELLRRLGEIFSIVRSWNDRNQVFTLFVYLVTVVKEKDVELDEFLENIPRDMKSEVITLADRLLEEGREQGREEGRERSRIETIENMLRKGFGIDLICDIMKVSRDYVEYVRNDMDKKE